MNDQGDYKDLMKQKHFLGEVEQAIKFANSELIHKHIPSLNKDTILAFAVQVGKLRASYLEAAFKVARTEGTETLSEEVVRDIKNKRELFEETRMAFDDLKDCIEKGYIDIEELD